MAKKLLCIILSVLMIMSVLPMGIVAADRDTVTIDGVEYTVVADSSTSSSSGGWNSYFDYTYKSYAMTDDAMIYLEYTCTVAPTSYASIKYQYGKDSSYDYYDAHYFRGSIETTDGTHSYAVSASTMKNSDNQYGLDEDYSWCGIIVQWGDSSSSETTTDFTLTYVALLVPVEDSDDDSSDSGTTTTVSSEYTFSDVTVSNRWSSSTTYAANTDGSLTYTFTSQYEEIWFSLPDGIDTDAVISITINVTSGSTSSMGVKLYDSTTSCYVTYGNSTLTIASAGTSSTSSATAGKIGIMYTGSDNSDGVEYTFSGFSITYTSTSSSDDDDDDSGDDDTGDTTDYTFPIEGITMGSAGSASYDSTTGTITFTSGTWTSSGWWFDSDSTVKIESLTITFAEATSHYMNVAVQYVDSDVSDTSVAINSGSTSVTVTPEDAYIKQIYIADSNSNGGTLQIASVTYTLPSDDEETTIAAFYTRTLSLGGKIGINYYVDFTDVDNPEDYSVVFTVDGTTTTVTYDESSAGSMGDAYRMYTCKVPCWKMGATVEVSLMNGETEVQTDTYSVSKFATNMAGKSTTAFDDVINTLMTYGHYAYAYKGTGTDVTYSYTDNTSSVTTSTLAGYKPTVSAENVVSATLVLDATCELRFYVDSSYTVAIDGTEVSASGTDSTGTYYSITDILVQDWNEAHTVTVTDDDGTVCTVTNYSVLSYAYSVVSDNSDSALVSLVQSMYLYNAAVDAYF